MTTAGEQTSMASMYFSSAVRGSSSSTPFLISSSGDGRWAIFSFRVSALKWRSSSFWCARSAGAAVEAGRMLPGR